MLFSEPLASHQSVVVFIKQYKRFNLLLLLQLICQSLVRYELVILFSDSHFCILAYLILALDEIRDSSRRTST